MAARDNTLKTIGKNSWDLLAVAAFVAFG